MADEMPELDEIDDALKKIALIMMGKESEVCGAILADLLLTWVIGHSVPGNREETTRLRTALIEEHLNYVLDMAAELDKTE
jgi:hypothetical protein